MGTGGATVRSGAPLLLVAASIACASTRPGALERGSVGEPATGPWADGQQLVVHLRARGQRNVDALTQRWDMTLEQRWKISLEAGDRMAIAMEPLGEWRGELAAPDASAGTAYYLGFVTGAVMDRRGQVVAVRGGESAKEKARRTREALGHLDHTAGAELDRALDDRLLAQAWGRLLRRLALRDGAAGAERRFAESSRFAISGDHPVEVAYRLTRVPAPCPPGAASGSCLRIELSGRADRAALLAGYAATAMQAELEDVSRETTSWVLVTGPRRDPIEVGDRIRGHDRWKTGSRSTEARLDDEIIVRFTPHAP